MPLKNMYLPYMMKKKISKQDDSFLENQYGILKIHQRKYPLLLHYHPLTIYRYQVNKQADTVLSALLFPDEFSRTKEERF